MKVMTNIIPKVSLVTAHGRTDLNYRTDERLIDCLERNNIPWSAVSIYVRRGDGKLHLYNHLERQIPREERDAEFLIYYSRNINPFTFAFDDF
jgi:hypothetical protein